MTLRLLTQLTETGTDLEGKREIYREVDGLLVSAPRNLQSRENPTFAGDSHQAWGGHLSGSINDIGFRLSERQKET